MASVVPMQGVLRVVPPGALDRQIEAQDRARAAAQDAAKLAPETLDDLAAFVRTQYEIMRTHRNGASGWSGRLMAALRAFNGEYDPDQLAEIQKFGGSEVYARVIAMKCRGTTSLLRDVYLSPDRAWGIEPPSDPDVPQNVADNIKRLVESELSNVEDVGEQIDTGVIRDRVIQLMDAARQAAKKRAGKRAKLAEDKIDEILDGGGFYKALAEFLVDLPLFPFACIKGPVVRIVPTVSYRNGRASVENKAKMFWQRVSPFDLYWTPGASDIEDAAVIERERLTRADLNDLLDLPGYNQKAIRSVLEDYGSGGLADNWDALDAERAVQESRENPQTNRSGIINCLVYTGNVQGKLLLQYGVDKKYVADELRDYMVAVRLIGRHVIKVQFSPSPRKRHEYFITSFEKVPGTPVGNGLPEILSDVQNVCNASLRALVNNLSIASGPQAMIDTTRLDPGEDAESMYPWKRWLVKTDPMANNSQAPVSFFQPTSNAEQLLSVYEKFNAIADELSAIPKYLSGNSVGGAGRTASGLAMLMGNASKILQTVCANVDRDVFSPLLTNLYDMLMLTDETGILQGDESVKVMGVTVAVQRETQRARQLEFLQITANPIDMQIIGPKGRAEVLRSVSSTIGMDGERIVPPEDQLEMMEQAQQQMAQLGAQAQGDQQGQAVTQDMGPRTRIAGGAG